MNELILIIYIISLLAILLFSGHGFIMLYLAGKIEDVREKIPGEFNDNPYVTIQLPIYNEMYVVERLLDAVCNIEYDKAYMEIQVLDDSTDATVEIVEKKIIEKNLKVSILFISGDSQEQAIKPVL